MLAPSSSRAAAMLLAASVVEGHDFYKIGTRDEIIASAKDLAATVMAKYPRGGTAINGQPLDVGILPGPPDDGKGPYYWWQAGAMWGLMIDYWSLTGDTKYNELITEGLIAQMGEARDYEPFSHRASLGNDDQAFWGMAVLNAIEHNFPDSENNDDPGWLALAQAVFVRQSLPERHDNVCGGGMRWQVPVTNKGYDYKNTIANACYFNMGARLSRYTGNMTYAEKGEVIYDWIHAVKYIEPDTWKVYDGGHTGENSEVVHNCTDINPYTFSYNTAILLQGAAFMWNMSVEENLGSEKVAKWKLAVDKLTNTLERDFFKEKGAAYEPNCEPDGGCTPDMFMFKGFVHRWAPTVAKLAPFTASTILPMLRQSTEKALTTCYGPNGNPGERLCGFFWSEGKYKDPATHKFPTDGVPEQMNVLSAVTMLLHEHDAEVPTSGPLRAKDGANSRGDENAGQTLHENPFFKEITTADRAGAGILTMLIIGSGLGVFGWMGWD